MVVAEALAILFGMGPAAVVVVRALAVVVEVVGVCHTVREEAAVLLSQTFWDRREFCSDLRASCWDLRGGGIVAVVMEVDSRRNLTMVEEVVVLCPDHILASIFVLCVVQRKSGRLVLRTPGFHVDSLLSRMLVIQHYQLLVQGADVWEISAAVRVFRDPRAHTPEAAECRALDDRNPNLPAILESPVANHQSLLCFVFLVLFFSAEIARMLRRCASSFRPQIVMLHVHPLVSALVLMRYRLSCIENFLLVVALAAYSVALLGSSARSVVVVEFFSVVVLQHLLVALAVRPLCTLHNLILVVHIFRAGRMRCLDWSLKVVRVVLGEVVDSVVSVEDVLVG